MTQTSAIEFLAAVKQDEGLRKRLKTAESHQSCIDLAEQSGYFFTAEELQAVLSQMSDEELAEIINPGIAPRQHIDPR
jgi:predicted ribosomally synthesized peptide with nif11-like leader